MRMTRQEKEQWERLYTLTDKLDRLSPWEWMGMADCFGLRFHGINEPCFVIFGGQPHDFRYIRFLMGWKAFYDLVSRLIDPSKQTSTWLLEIPMIELLFVKAEFLFDHEKEILKKLKRMPEGDGEVPVFRSILPGYHPWLPDKDERKLLEAAVYQTFGMTMRVESDGMLLKGKFPHEVLMRTQDEEGNWSDAWSGVKDVADEEIEVRIASKVLRALKAKPLLPTTVQLDMVFMPLVLGEDKGRPRTTYVLFMVDAESGAIMADEVFHATEGIPQMWATIPERLLEVFERLGGCPAVIEVSSDRMTNLLRPLGELIPFKMVRHSKLAVLERVREKLCDDMTNMGLKN